MPRHAALILLTSALLLAACASPTVDGGRQTADGGPLTVTPTETPAPTETPTPPPSLESLGLNEETQAILTRQGWQITWNAQEAQYDIRQRERDEASQSFTSEIKGAIGYIDLEGNLHIRLTRFSAGEDQTTGEWTNQNYRDNR